MPDPKYMNKNVTEADMLRAVRTLLDGIADDPTREGLKETPKRFLKAWQFWTKGYTEKPEDIMKTFENPSVDQLVIVKDINFYSLCEHHLAPFFGTVSIGYLPSERVLGLSKFARLVDIYARRLQIQEGMAQSIAGDIMKYLKPLGVAVRIEGTHLCMRSRGVQKENSKMISSVMLGKFRDEPELRAEFLSLLKK